MKRFSPVLSLALFATASVTPLISVAENRGADFPKVSPSAQKERDDSRKAILSAELDAERARLAATEADLLAAKAAKKQQSAIAALEEDVNRSKVNVEALKREISLVGATPLPALAAAQPRVKTDRLQAKQEPEREVNNAAWWNPYARNRAK